MLLVFQIAAGIVLAVVIIQIFRFLWFLYLLIEKTGQIESIRDLLMQKAKDFGETVVIVTLVAVIVSGIGATLGAGFGYYKRQVLEEKKIAAEAEARANRASDLATQKRLKELRQQAEKQQQEDEMKAAQIAEQAAAEARMKKQTAWSSYYEELYNCKYPESEGEKKWCLQRFIRMKNEFEDKWANGEIPIK